MHYLYHEELYQLLEKELKQRKVLDADAKRNARRSYGRLFSKLDPKAQEEVLARVVAHAEEFDKRYAMKEYPDKRQRLAAAVKRGIKEAKAEAKAAKSAKPAKAPKSVKPAKPAKVGRRPRPPSRWKRHACGCGEISRCRETDPIRQSAENNEGASSDQACGDCEACSHC